MIESGNNQASSGMRLERVDDELLQWASPIDYGSFLWVEIEPHHAGRWILANPGRVVRERAFELNLGGIRFDPLTHAPVVDELVSNWQADEGPDWRLIQLRGPVKQEWLDSIRALGVEPVQYVHPFTYIVWSDAAAMQRLSGLDALRWQGEFLPAYRLPPLFRRQGRAQIDVTLMVRAGLDTLPDQLQRIGAEVIASGRMDSHFEVIDLRTSENQLARLAAIPGVYSVQPVATDGGTRSEMSVQINHDNVDGAGVAQTGYLDYLDMLGLNGSGVVLAVVDNGTQSNHPDLVNRILPCVAPSCGNGSQTDGHGTHVAGIMVADGSSGTLNSGGFLRGLGMAPNAGLIEQRNASVGAPYMLNLMRDSVRNGATISNNSWGPSGSPLGYDNNTRQVDVGVRDSDADEAGDQSLNYILAFMNGFGGTSSQGTPDEAKNTFTIGSAWAQVNSNTQDMRNDDISVNSAHGPALDGRFLPHMIAASRFTDSTLGTTGYGMQGGTSQAAPHVAGAVALFTERYQNEYGMQPSPALVKAVFLAVSRDLEGNDDADDNPIGARPTNTQGWGRMHLKPVLSPDHSVVYVDQTHVFSDTGQNWSIDLSADEPDQPMHLMLVWTDAPGHGLGGSTPAWNNDLDLRVSAGGNLYLGNVFDQAWSATGGSPDSSNNTEGVLLQSAQHQGQISVEVLAANINSNALPNAGGGNLQDFALVCYNCVGEEADVGVGLTAVPDPVQPGDLVTWVLQVANFGPDSAVDPTVSLTLPPEVTYQTHRTLSAGTLPEWDCSPSGDVIECLYMDTLSPATLAPTLEIDTQVDSQAGAGSISAVATVQNNQPDPNAANDSAEESVLIATSEDPVFEDRFENE